MKWKVKFHIIFTHDSGNLPWPKEKFSGSMIVDAETEEEAQNIVLERYEYDDQELNQYLYDQNKVEGCFGKIDNEELEFDSCERLNSTE